jgi:hypothetical protein
MHFQLTESQIEFLLYVDSKKYFSIDDIAPYTVVMKQFPNLFRDLLTRNFISIFTEKRRGKSKPLRTRIGKVPKKKKVFVYTISPKGRSLITKLYQLTESQREYNHTSTTDALGKYRLNLKVEAIRELVLEMMRVMHENAERKNYKPEFDHLLDF